MSEERVRIEEFELSGEKIVAKIRELVHEGNVRRISLKTRDGDTLVDIPLSVGVAGAAATAALAPVLAAIGTIAAMVANLKIVVERVE